MQVQHRRTYVRLGPTEGFKDWKDLKRLDYTEGEDGQACVRVCKQTDTTQLPTTQQPPKTDVDFCKFTTKTVVHCQQDYLSIPLRFLLFSSTILCVLKPEEKMYTYSPAGVVDNSDVKYCVEICNICWF